MRLFFSFWLASVTVFSQNNEEVFQTIKSQFETITNLKKEGLLQEKTNSYSCPDQSLQGILSYFYQGSELQLITHTVDQGHHSITYHYYINNDLLFFCFIEEGFDNDVSQYDPNTGDLVEVEENWNIIEQRIYYNNNEAIRCLEKYFDNKDVNDEITKQFSDVSDHFSNQGIPCDNAQIRKIFKRFSGLLLFKEDPCMLHGK